MSEPISRSQVDKLGARLRAGTVDEDDIRLLDAFKGMVMFRTANLAARVEEVVRQGQWDFTKRRQKTNPSIIQKLRRSTTSLSRMQDISACRIIVPTLPDLTDYAWGELKQVLGDIREVDRLEGGHLDGYRAVHL